MRVDTIRLHVHRGPRHMCLMHACTACHTQVMINARALDQMHLNVSAPLLYTPAEIPVRTPGFHTFAMQAVVFPI